MAHYIKCPQCSEEGYQYLEDKRRRFRCNACGLDTYLKLISSYANDEKMCMCTKRGNKCMYHANAKDETPEHKRQSIETES